MPNNLRIDHTSAEFWPWIENLRDFMTRFTKTVELIQRERELWEIQDEVNELFDMEWIFKKWEYVISNLLNNRENNSGFFPFTLSKYFNSHQMPYVIDYIEQELFIYWHDFARKAISKAGLEKIYVYIQYKKIDSLGDWFLFHFDVP